MAKPTEAQIKQLENAHKLALSNLLQAIRFRKIIYKKMGSKNDTYQNYAKFIWKLWQSWYARQLKYEKAGAQKEYILKDDWINDVTKLEALAKKWDAAGKGIGFIPLIIWAVVAIAGFFTAEEIVDELNVTNEEQESLIKTSQEICEKNNFSPAECKAYITQQTEAVQSGGAAGGYGKYLMLAGLAFLAYTYISKKQTTQTT